MTGSAQKPAIRSPLTAKGGFEGVRVVGFETHEFTGASQQRPQAPHELGQEIAPVVVAGQGHNDRLGGRAGPLLEDLELDLEGGSAGDRARADAQEHLVERVGIADGVRGLDQPVCQLFEWRLGNVRVVVPDDTCPAGFVDGRNQRRMLVAPEHLIMPGRAVEKQTPLLAQVEQAPTDQQIIARSGVIPSVGGRQNALVNRGKRRNPGHLPPHPAQQRGGFAPGQPAPACVQGRDGSAAFGSQQAGQGEIESSSGVRHISGGE